MDMLSPYWMRGLLVAACLFAFAGCQSAATLSLAARSGDTVLVGLSADAGEAFSNATAEIIRTQDITATITDSSGSTVPVRVRNVFRAYGDPTASNYAANKGQWLAVIDFVDGARNPAALSEGPATLTISSPKLRSVQTVETTILAGTGEIHPLTGSENGLAKLQWLTPSQQALVSVSGDQGSALIGAVQYQFTVPQEPLETPRATLSAINGIKLVGRRDISFLSWTAPAPGGGTSLTVVMTAPDGVSRRDLRELDMALVGDLVNRSDDPPNYFTGSLQSAVFYNTEGDLMNGLTATVGLVE